MSICFCQLNYTKGTPNINQTDNLLLIKSHLLIYIHYAITELCFSRKLTSLLEAIK